MVQVYVGELVEEACAARETNREEGPLQPKHVREAVRRLKNNNKVPNSRYKKVFPFRWTLTHTASNHVSVCLFQSRSFDNKNLTHSRSVFDNNDPVIT